METLTYRIEIDAPRPHVWETMLAPDGYRHWVKAFSPGSTYAGEWLQGTHMDFYDPEMGGTRALLEVVDPPASVHARHVATLGKDRAPETASEIALKWIGSTETYTLEDTGGATTLTIEVRTHPDFVAMFEAAWPKALGMLKELCEEPAATSE
jgi:hypothetical protein